MKTIRYRSYHLYYGFKYWLRVRFTRAGQLALVICMVAAMFGIDTNLNLSYQIFCFMVAILAVAILFGMVPPPRVTAIRHLPRFGVVDRPFSYLIHLRNHSRRPQKGLTASEWLSDPRPPYRVFEQASEPGEKRRNIFDRWMGYHRWAWLVSVRTGSLVTVSALPDLSPGSETAHRMTLTPRRRGRLSLAGLTIARADPFGLFNAIRRVQVKGSVTVLPKLYPMAPVVLPGTRQFQPGGVALASSVGEAEEFVSLRDYRPSDPLRRIHWKSWAKTGKPIVKEYQEEYFVRHALILDTFHPISGNTIFEEAVSVAASLVCAMQGQESLLDLMFIGPEAYCFTSGRGLAHTDRMLEILASVDVCTDKAFTSLHPLVFQRVELLSASICIFLSWDDERRQMVERLQRLGLPLKVIVVCDQGTASDLDPGPMKTVPEHFHPLETGSIEEGLAAI